MQAYTLPEGRALVSQKVAQQGVHPTGGSRRVFEEFAWLEVGPGKVASSRPAHQRVTQAVRRTNSKSTPAFLLSFGNEF